MTCVAAGKNDDDEFERLRNPPIFHKVVLKGISGQDDPPPGLDVLESLGDGGVRIFDSVTLVANDQVRTWIDQGALDVVEQALGLVLLFNVDAFGAGGLLLGLALARLLVGELTVELVTHEQNAAHASPFHNHLKIFMYDTLCFDLCALYDMVD